MPPHPPSHKQASITPLPLPLPNPTPTQFPYQSNMLDPGTKLPKLHPTLSDPTGRRWSDSYDSYDHAAMSYDFRVQKTAMNYARDRSWNGSSMTMVDDDDDESGVCTPPLWTTSPSRSPPHRHGTNYRCLSPTSKAQAIARGQKELMEMVSRMPESCYELSLKDLVENQYQPQHQPQAVAVAVEPKQESFAEGRGVANEGNVNKKKNKAQNSQKPQVNRSGSIDNGGLLLKMVFPTSLGSKKKKSKKNDRSNTNQHSKVSPKPPVSDASGKSSVDKDWWKKRSGSSESESGGSSTVNSGSTSSTSSSSSSCKSISNCSSRDSRKTGCLAFILLMRKSKASR